MNPKEFDLNKAELDRNVLEVLRAYPHYNLRPGQIVKLIFRKRHNYRNFCIPGFFMQAIHVRDALHRLERVGKATCERPERSGRSKRWCFVQETADTSHFLNTRKTRHFNHGELNEKN